MARRDGTLVFCSPCGAVVIRTSLSGVYRHVNNVFLCYALGPFDNWNTFASAAGDTWLLILSGAAAFACVEAAAFMLRTRMMDAACLALWRAVLRDSGECAGLTPTTPFWVVGSSCGMSATECDLFIC